MGTIQPSPGRSDKHRFAITIDDVTDAARRLRSAVLRTPLVPNEKLSNELGVSISFKAENLQHIGAFKARGAANAVSMLDDKVAATGVVTHSSGNHAAALARAARQRKIPAHIVMPHNSARTKIEAVRRFAVEPVFCEPTIEARVAGVESLQIKTGAHLVHPYNDPSVMAGQGTVGLEILEQCPEVDVIVVPVGGGGLLSGVLVAVKSLRPEVRVIAAEPAWADDAARSLRSGRIESPNRYDSVADGLRTSLGSLTFPIIQALVDEIVLVSEESIVQAESTLFRDVKLVAEPSGAVSLAAIYAKQQELSGKSVVAVITGGNRDAPPSC